MQRDLLGIIIVDFDATGQLLIIETSKKLIIQLGGRFYIIFSLSLVSL